MVNMKQNEALKIIDEMNSGGGVPYEDYIRLRDTLIEILEECSHEAWEDSPSRRCADCKAWL